MLFVDPRNGKPLEDQGVFRNRILYHWEMSSSRNYRVLRNTEQLILYHWEMSSSRNSQNTEYLTKVILYHWEMSSSPNKDRTL